MDTRDIKKMLAEHQLPPAALPLHKYRLKALLLSAKHFRQSPYAKALEIIHITISRTMSYKKTFLSLASAATVLTLATIFSFSTVQIGQEDNNTYVVSAKELVKQAAAQTDRLAPDVREAWNAELEAYLGTDHGKTMNDVFAEALAAADLRLVTQEEFLASKPGDYPRWTNRAGGDVATYFLYTNKDGQEVAMGIDQNKALVFITVSEEGRIFRFHNGKKLPPDQYLKNLPERPRHET